mmetsp:Transcript_24786/g.54023  ORF Transcript_24786/g.54023 Transcript_24786/m.54023 type:complete len:263 (-) Transcript_24786:260-1048(-)
MPLQPLLDHIVLIPCCAHIVGQVLLVLDGALWVLFSARMGGLVLYKLPTEQAFQPTLRGVVPCDARHISQVLQGGCCIACLLELLVSQPTFKASDVVSAADVVVIHHFVARNAPHQAIRPHGLPLRHRCWCVPLHHCRVDDSRTWCRWHRGRGMGARAARTQTPGHFFLVRIGVDVELQRTLVQLFVAQGAVVLPLNFQPPLVFALNPVDTVSIIVCLQNSFGEGLLLGNLELFLPLVLLSILFPLLFFFFFFLLPLPFVFA